MRHTRDAPCQCIVVPSIQATLSSSSGSRAATLSGTSIVRMMSRGVQTRLPRNSTSQAAASSNADPGGDQAHSRALRSLHFFGSDLVQKVSRDCTGWIVLVHRACPWQDSFRGFKILGRPSRGTGRARTWCRPMDLRARRRPRRSSRRKSHLRLHADEPEDATTSNCV
jgi:hypothetical protein